jgi:uncharacterized lipoprotein YmbA
LRRLSSRALPLAGVAWAALTFAGCASNPPPRMQVIIPSLLVAAAAPASTPPSTPEATPPAAPATRARQVALGVVRVPEYWQQRTVRHLGQGPELVAWPNAVWAERVEVGMTRRLGEALRQQAPEQGWWVADDLRSPSRLLVDVTQLDIDPQAGRLRAVVNWRLLDRQGQVQTWGTLTDDRAVTVHDALQQAEALGQWLDTLAARITPQVRATLASLPAAGG